MKNLKIIEKKGDIILLAFVVQTGSIDEFSNHAGISHFLEHLLFTGTKNKTNSKELTKDIKLVGGEINAFTSYYSTVYYVKIYKKHFNTAFETLKDMFLNTVITEEKVGKEKQIILVFAYKLKRYQNLLKVCEKKQTNQEKIDQVKSFVENLKEKIIYFYGTSVFNNNLVEKCQAKAMADIIKEIEIVLES